MGCFTAPSGCKPGQPVWVQGPHGPLQVQAPAGVKPGKRVVVRLAAPFQHKVVVPMGAMPGDQLLFRVPVAAADPNASFKELAAAVPPSMAPGQYFAAMINETPQAQCQDVVEVFV